jgi:PKD repeat protein
MNEQSAETPLTISAGTTVHFNANTINHPAPVVYAYEWDLKGSGTSFDTINAMLDEQGDIWPPSSASFAYTTPGTYTVRVKMISDYGSYEKTGTVIVTGQEPPTAAFGVVTASPIAGQPVAFDASGSSAGVGSSIVNYHWEWGDGSVEDDSEPHASHTYAAGGSYTVKLTVRDSASRVSQVVSQSVTVASASGGPPPPPPPPPPHETPPDHTPTNVNPQASATGAAANVVVSCPATKVSCGGTVEIKTASAVAASVRGRTFAVSSKKRGRHKPKKSQLLLGQVSFEVAGGHSKTITVHLSSKGLSVLNKLKHLSVLVIVSAHDSFGDPLTSTVSLTLKAPAKKGSHANKKKH